MRSLVLGALWLAPLSLLGCADTNSNWTNLINPWARATPTPEAAPSATLTTALEGSTPPASSPRKRARASGQSATQRAGPSASASNPKLGEPQLEDTSANYQVSAVEARGASSGIAHASGPGAASAASAAASAAETITLGERPESSGTPGTPATTATGNVAATLPGATPTATAAPANESIQAKAERMMRTVKATAKQIDQASLSASESSRFTLAAKLIRNAEKPMAEHDFAAAASLAKKAIDLLAPLPRVSASMRAHH